MDAFEDGKFPLGTDCSSPGSTSGNGHQPAYCVDGRCIKFDENDFPVETSQYLLKQKIVQRLC